MKIDQDKINEKLKMVRELESQRNHQKVMYSNTNINVSQYHAKRKKVIEKILEKFARDSKFLDIGCAEGVYCQLAKNFGAKEVVGIDVSKTKIERATKKIPECQFYVKDITNSDDMKEFYKQFNLVMCSEVLQHVLDYKLVVHEILKCSMKKGFILITVPDYAQSDSHEMAKISDNMSPQEMLYEIGGAGFGKQTAIWKFNANRAENELQKEFPLSIVKSIHVGPFRRKILKGRCTFKIMLFRVRG